MNGLKFDRRRFVEAGLATVALGTKAFCDQRPPVADPRAIDGDEVHEPNWDERLTITVGPKQADLVGTSDKVIQAAVDYAARLGSGTVKILPGTYTLRNAVYLPSKIRVLGSGLDTIITKIPSVTVALAEDSDWYDQEITLGNAQGFQVGDGIVLRATDPHHGGQLVLKRTLVAKAGGRFKLNAGLRKNLWLTGKPTCASLFPLFTSERTHDVVIENLTFDGDSKNNENLNGNYGGSLFFQDCNRYVIRGVTARNYNGDGISFQICHDFVVENCHIHDNANLGVHPGSGSQRPWIRNNRLEHNDQGLFWCWGVKYGLAENNRIEGNHSYGTSIGHNDTDNVMRNNKISGSGKVGILFRDDQRGQDFWANRNTIEGNLIVNSGGEDGVAIDIRGKTKDLTIIGNTIQEKRAPMRRIGIRIDQRAGKLELAKNTIEGFAQDIVDQRS